MAARSRPFSIFVLVVVSFTSILAHSSSYRRHQYPLRYSSAYYDFSGYYGLQPVKFYWSNYQYPSKDNSKPPSGGNPGSPGGIGILPEQLNELYELIHNIIDALGQNTGLLGQIGITSDILTSLDTLLQQILVSQVAPCGNNDQGVLPDLLNDLYQFLHALLSSNAGERNEGSLGSLGVLPDLLNALSEFLRHLLTSSAAGGINGVGGGTIPDLLDALDNILRELLSLQIAQCPGTPSQWSICYNRFRSRYYCCYSRPNRPGSSGFIGVVPEALNDIYQLLSQLLDAVAGNSDLLGKLNLPSGLIPSLKKLLEQLLVSSTLPCSDANEQGTVPDLLNALTDLLTRLLASDGGDSGGGLLEPGIVPNLLNSVVELLQRLLGTGDGTGGGPLDTGVVPGLLNALNRILRHLLSSRKAQCSLPPGSVWPPHPDKNPPNPHSKPHHYPHEPHGKPSKPSHPSNKPNPPSGQPGGSGILPNLIDIVLELIRELIAAQVNGGQTGLDEGVLPSLLDALANFLTELFGSQGSTSTGGGVARPLFGELSTLVETLLSSQGGTGGSQGTIPELLEALYNLLNQLLRVGPNGQSGVLPEAFSALDELLRRLLVSNANA